MIPLLFCGISHRGPVRSFFKVHDGGHCQLIFCMSTVADTANVCTRVLTEKSSHCTFRWCSSSKCREWLFVTCQSLPGQLCIIWFSFCIIFLFILSFHNSRILCRRWPSTVTAVENLPNHRVACMQFHQKHWCYISYMSKIWESVSPKTSKFMGV